MADRLSEALEGARTRCADKRFERGDHGGPLHVGAFGGRADLTGAFDPGRGGFGHAGTSNNNASTMAVGAVVTSELLGAEALAAVNERGDRLRAGPHARFDVSPLPFGVTGRGSLRCIHPVAMPSSAVARSGRRWPSDR